MIPFYNRIIFFPFEILINYACSKKQHIFEELVNLPSCNKCEGNGWFPEYHNVADGICYDCNGTGLKNLR